MKNSTPFLLLIFLFGLFLFIAPETKAQRVGSLDSSFGAGGILDTALSNAASLKSLIVQPDGKIVVVGTITVPIPMPEEPSNGGSYFVARFNTNGTLDTTFDTDGYNNTFNFSSVKAVTLQSDGKIVIAGHAPNSANRPSFAVARFNTDGSLDSTFNGTGRVVTTFGLDATANSVSIQPDGKIIAAGNAALSSVFSNRDFALVRYNTDGSLDTSFGSGGRVATDFNNGTDEIYDTLVQPDGRIVAAGYSTDILSNTKLTTLVRYNSDGSLDSSFGSNGKTVKPGLFDSFASKIALQSDGEIIVVGEGNPTLRYNSNGILDTTFQSAGNNFIGISVVIQPDGKVIVGGAELGNNSPTSLAVARYNSDGTLDTSFGSGGKVVTTLPAETYNYNSGAVAIALEPDGKIVAGNTTTRDGNFHILIARYQNDLGIKSEKKRVRFFN